MLLHSFVVTVAICVCIVGAVDADDKASTIATPTGITVLNRNPAVGGSAEADDYYYPHLNWSDTLDWQLLKVR